MFDELINKLPSLPVSEEEQLALKAALQFVKYMTQYKTSTGPFICGVSGEADSGGLHEQIHVCAAYGSDYVAIYKKVHGLAAL